MIVGDREADRPGRRLAQRGVVLADRGLARQVELVGFGLRAGRIPARPSRGAGIARIDSAAGPPSPMTLSRRPRPFLQAFDQVAEPSRIRDPTIRTETERHAFIRNRVPADQARDRRSFPTGGGQEASGSRTTRDVDDTHDDRRKASRIVHGSGERRSWRVGAQVEDPVSGVGKDVSEHGHPESVTLAGRHRDNDDSLPAARVHEPRTQTSDQRRGHTAREMLLLDGDATRSPRRPDGMQRRREDADIDLAWLEPRCHGSLDDLPATRGVTTEHPRLQSLLPDRYARMAAPPVAAATFGRCRRPLEIRRSDQPRAAKLARWQDPQPDATVDRHVVDPEKIGRLVQAEMAATVRDQPARVPANTCQASADFATRLSMK